MTFQGKSVISAVWGVVLSAASRQPVSQPIWSMLRFFRRHPQQRRQSSPRLPVASPEDSKRASDPEK